MLSVAERLWSHADRSIPDGCWEWTGTRTGQGYGQIGVQGRVRPVHRVAYELLVGPIPDGLEIDHLCRNRACVNPAHMEPVTHAENVRRGIVGINHRSKTHCPHGHPYDEANTFVRHRSHGIHRQCRTCMQITQDRRREAGDRRATPTQGVSGLWLVVPKFTPAAARLADGHYSRRTIGSPQFMPPGQTLVLLTPDELAVFGWWRPHPSSGIVAMNHLDGWTCTIFRNTGTTLSSELILAAERELLSRYDCGPDGLLTYVWDRKVQSANPGYCFKVAGWTAIGRSADGRKTLLHKSAALEASK